MGISGLLDFDTLRMALDCILDAEVGFFLLAALVIASLAITDRATAPHPRPR